MPLTPTPTLWILKTSDALPPLRTVHGDFEDWIARGLVQDNNLSALPVQTLDARTTTAWPAMETVASVVVTGSPAMVTDREPWPWTHFRSVHQLAART